MGEAPSGTGLGCTLSSPTDIPVHLLLAKLAANVLPMEAKVGQESWSGACLGIWSFSFLVLKRIGRVHYRFLLTGELSRVEMAKYDCVLSLNKTPSISFRESLDDKQYSCALNREGGFWFLTPVLYWPCYPLIAVPCL